MYINSGGGSVPSGLAIVDIMNYVTAPISPVCRSQACSIVSILLASGTLGLRKALPNARVMIHQPSRSARGKASHTDIDTKEALETARILNRILSDTTGKEISNVEKAMITR